MKNHNRPQPGSILKTEPIKTLKDVKAIKKLLADSPRDLCLFTCGVSWLLRAGDLLSIRVGQVRSLKVGESFTIREQKCGKVRVIAISKGCHEVIQALLTSMGDKATDDAPLFRSRKGGALTVSTLGSMVKEWCDAIHIPGQHSSHTLRKTGAYLNRVCYGVDVATLMQALGHSSQQMTMTYLCIQPEEVQGCYLREF
ncbi:MAG: tyrosine-type recombinase/integrase [Chlorobium sp.]|nr:tyrosine-type recombinase/integrase [Chlorobium sp.]